MNRARSGAGRLLVAVLVSACGAAAPPTTGAAGQEPRAATPAVLEGVPVSDATAPAQPQPQPQPVAKLPTASSCGGFEELPLGDAPVDLLDGRLRMRAPEGARLQARAHNVMGAAIPEAEESRVLVEQQQRKLVVMVNETFHTPGADLAASLRKMGLMDPATPFVAGSLKGLMVTPGTLEPESGAKDALLVRRLVLRSPDDTVQVLTFYVNPEVVTAGADGCQALALRLAATLTPGGRKLELAGGRKPLEGGISIDVPRDHALTVQQGPDFAVYTLHWVAPPEKQASLHVYLGDYPSLERMPNTTTFKGRLFGQPVDFQEMPTVAGTLRQAVVAVPGGNRLMAHVFYVASEPKELAALAAAAASLVKAP